MSKILFISNTSEYFFSHRIDLARQAKAEGHQIHLAAPHSPKTPAIQSIGVQTHDVPFFRKSSGLVSELRAVLAIIRTIDDVKPDIVHCIALKSAVFGTLAARLKRVKRIVCTIAGLGHLFVDGGIRKKITLYLFLILARVTFRSRKVDLIFQNEDDRTLFINKGLATSDKTVVIPGSGVDPDKYSTSTEFPEDVIVMLAARLLWSKGIGTFVDAAKRMKESAPDIRFVIVGGIDEANPDFVPAHKLKEWSDKQIIEWWGYQENMIDILKQASIVALPTYYREGVPKVLIEAAAMSKPIITTDSPGCRDIVSNNSNGILIKPRDDEALAAAITQLANEPKLRKEMGKNGRKRVIDSFSMSRVNRMTIDLYAE